MTQLDKRYWQERYRQKQTAWDAHQITQPLKTFMDSWMQRDAAIFIPGCGNAHEALYLLENGFTRITVVDIAQEPLDALKERANSYIEQGFLNLVCADFFETSGTYDLILEQTFFCALDPNLRSRYAEKMHSLLNPNGMVCGLLFDFPLTEEGPPFGGNAEEYHMRFSPYFRIERLEPCYNSIKPRAGRELFLKMTRK